MGEEDSGWGFEELGIGEFGVCFVEREYPGGSNESLSL